MKRVFAILALGSLLAVQTPVIAQNTDNSTTTTRTTSDDVDDDDNDDNNWGLAGLLGLLGLLGLRRKDDDRRHVTTVRRD